MTANGFNEDFIYMEAEFQNTIMFWFVVGFFFFFHH